MTRGEASRVICTVAENLKDFSESNPKIKETVFILSENAVEALQMAADELAAHPCEDAISRQAMLEMEKECYRDSDNIVELDESLRYKIPLLPSVQPKARWIPVSERLPKDRDWYLGIFKEPDTGWINPLPFICDYVGRETKATTKEFWILRGFTDRDERIDYYFNLECVAWQPLPESYKKSEVEE